jgi:hypothetical protein
LVIDADELVTPELRDYLYKQIQRPDCPDGIAIPRRNYFMGRFLHSAYPDYVLRFFRRDVTHWPPVIHCSPKVEGKVERIPRNRRELALEHLANDSVSDILRKSDTYSNYEVPRRRHKHYGLGALISRPLFRFFKSYIIKRGFLDGMPGLIHAVVNIEGRLATSNADVMLDATLESPEALRGYAQHPDHLAVANGKVRPYTASRACLDYEI